MGHSTPITRQKNSTEKTRTFYPKNKTERGIEKTKFLGNILPQLQDRKTVE